MDFQENLGSYKFPYISGRIWSLKEFGLFNFQEIANLSRVFLPKYEKF